MAHAGTQPAATGTTGHTGMWNALVAVIVVLAIGLAVVATTTFIAGSNRAIGAPAADHSYDKAEGVRAAAPLSGAVRPDRRFDELMLPAAAPAVRPDRRFDELMLPAAAPKVDNSVTKAEGIRGAVVLPSVLDARSGNDMSAAAYQAAHQAAIDARSGNDMSAAAYRAAHQAAIDAWSVDQSYTQVEKHRGSTILP